MEEICIKVSNCFPKEVKKVSRFLWIADRNLLTQRKVQESLFQEGVLRRNRQDYTEFSGISWRGH